MARKVSGQRSKRARRRPASVQLALPGFAKKSAKRGRKPVPGRRFVRHRVREAHSSAHPAHVVLRSRFRPLRSQFVFATVRSALAEATRSRTGFRVLQFSVQGDHLHLIVEASSKLVLSRGMQGLAIRIAKRVNRLVSRRGKLWADRFYSRALTSPRAVRSALGYVLHNFAKHRASGAARIDPYSSAPFFDGFRELGGKAAWDLPPSARLPVTPRGVAPPAGPEQVPVSRARTWLASSGWRKSGLLALAPP